LAHGLDQVRKRAPEPIELPNDEDVSLSHVGERLDQPWAIGFRSGRLVLKNPVAAGGAQRIKL
jgi:hypothetical protein